MAAQDRLRGRLDHGDHHRRAGSKPASWASAAAGSRLNGACPCPCTVSEYTPGSRVRLHLNPHRQLAPGSDVEVPHLKLSGKASSCTVTLSVKSGQFRCSRSFNSTGLPASRRDLAARRPATAASFFLQRQPTLRARPRCSKLANTAARRESGRTSPSARNFAASRQSHQPGPLGGILVGPQHEYAAGVVVDMQRLAMHSRRQVLGRGDRPVVTLAWTIIR